MVTKAYNIIRLICLALPMIVASYFEAPAAVVKEIERYRIQTTVVKSTADPELKAILEPVIEIGNVNTSGRVIPEMKKEGGVHFYDLSSLNEGLILEASLFIHSSSHIPLYISFRSILI